MRAHTPSPVPGSDRESPEREDATPTQPMATPLSARLAAATPARAAATQAHATGTPRPSVSRSASGSTPPLTRPARRPSVDEGIESGEIVDRRSLVIRSQPIPALEWNDAPTEISATPLPPRVRPWRMAAVGGAIALAVLAVMFAVRSGPDASKIDALGSRAEMVARTVDGDANAAIVRAEAIAASPVLRAAIVTDANTMVDLARSRDLTLSLRDHDVLEIYQLRGAKRLLLLRLPATAAPLEPLAAGTARIESRSDRLVVVASATIQSAATPDGRSTVAGQLVLSTPVDLNKVSKRIAEQASGAQLVGLKNAIVLKPSASAPNVTIAIPAKTPAAGTISLAAVVPIGASNSLFAWLCITLSAGLFATFVILHRRARRA
jgi:hypothetical protein